MFDLTTVRYSIEHAGLLLFGAIDSPVYMISYINLPGILLSWATNLWSTILVSWKTWRVYISIVSRVAS